MKSKEQKLTNDKDEKRSKHYDIDIFFDHVANNIERSDINTANMAVFSTMKKI